MAPLQILLIDNNLEEIRPLVDALHEQGYRYFCASDGTTGYARAVALLPDVIVLESQLQKMDGLTLARMLVANRQTAHIPLLFLAADAEPEMRVAGLRAGAVDYIVKPCYPAEVIERIEIHARLAHSHRPPVLEVDPLESQVIERDRAEISAQKETLSVVQRYAYYHEDVLFSAIQRIIGESLEQPPGAAELAESLGVSQRRVAAVVKAQTGGSLFELIRSKRMEKAARLLTRTGLSVTDIATEAGYSSAANFTTAFREYFGFTPTAYRRNPVPR